MKKRIASLIAASCAAFLLAAPATAATLFFDDFDSYAYEDSTTPGSVFGSGNWVSTSGNGGGIANCGGGDGCLRLSNDANGAAGVQSTAGIQLMAGSDYELTFDIDEIEAGTSFTILLGASIDVTWTSLSVGAYTLGFTALASEIAHIGFERTDNQPNLGPYLDNIGLTGPEAPIPTPAVPLPASGLMLLGGLLGVTALRRRRT